MAHPRFVGETIAKLWMHNVPKPHKEELKLYKIPVTITNDNTLAYMVPFSLMHALFQIRPQKTATLEFSKEKEETEEANVSRVAMFFGKEQVFCQETNGNELSEDGRVCVQLIGFPLVALYRDTITIHVTYQCPDRNKLKEKPELVLIGCLYKNPTRQMPAICGNFCLPVTHDVPKPTETRTFITALINVMHNTDSATNLLVIKNGRAKLMFDKNGNMINTCSLNEE